MDNKEYYALIVENDSEIVFFNSFSSKNDAENAIQRTLTRYFKEYHCFDINNLDAYIMQEIKQLNKVIVEPTFIFI